MTLSDKDLKNLVEEIKKEAARNPPPPPPTGWTSPGHSAAVRPSGGGGSGTVMPGNVDVMAMQHALQDLAQDVSAQINLQDAFSGDPRKEQEAKSRDAFGVFLTKNYMRNTKVPGVEFDPDPNVTTVSQKSPDDPTRMSVVMDTMSRIGSPKKGERFVDGRWGRRTSAAVRNAYAFASGLFDFVNDINRFSTKKINIKSYSESALKELEGIARAENLTPQQKSELVPVITQHIKAIKSMYDEVKNHILQHPAYQQFIEGDVPFKTYQSTVTPQQVELLKKTFPQGFNVNFGWGNTFIGVDSLTSLDALKTWIHRAVPDAEAKGTITPEKIISQIWEQNAQLLGADPGF